VYIGFSLNLAAIQTMHSSEANLRREIFPGLVYRSSDFPGITLLVFESGQIVITGAKSEEVARNSYFSLRPVLAEFRSTRARLPRSATDMPESVRELHERWQWKPKRGALPPAVVDLSAPTTQ
jgi:hypothetical protein